MIDKVISTMAKAGLTPCAIQDLLWTQHKTSVDIVSIRNICRGINVKINAIGAIKHTPDTAATVKAFATKTEQFKKEKQVKREDNKRRHAARREAGKCYVCGGARDTELSACSKCRARINHQRKLKTWSHSKRLGSRLKVD